VSGAVRLSRLAPPGLVLAGASANLLVALVAHRYGLGLAAFAAALPLVALGFACLVASDRAVLFLAAIALPISTPPLNRPFSMGGLQFFMSDALALLALSAWAAEVLLRARGMRRSHTHVPILGWPYVLFAAAVLVALARGHEAYGEKLFGSPLRLLFYAGIASTILHVDARRLYRGLVVVLYVGTVWTLLNAAYYLATGTSQTGSHDLPTGGQRTLSISVSMYMASALFLALLNLRLDQSARSRMVHMAIACLAAIGVVLGFGRTVFVATAIGVAVILVLVRHVRSAFLTVLPLCIPFLVIGGIFLPRAAPDVVPSFVKRVSASPTRDENVQWREKANRAIWAQVRESPVTGVGFGRGACFTVDVVSSSGVAIPQRQCSSQDPHNSFLYLWAAGGLLTLGSFILVLGSYALDLRRRFAFALDERERLLLIWSSLTLLIFVLNSVAGPLFESTPDLLVLWAVLAVPVAVQRR
jgi:hypothetical protein